MEEVKRLKTKRFSGFLYTMSLFRCPVCGNLVEKIAKEGRKSKSCSRRCYNKLRKGHKRGPYKESIIISNYRYLYMPEHPFSSGAGKLYVAEHRYVVEKHIGRYLTKTEVVHHKDRNTLNNDIKNLQLMQASDHNKLHKNERYNNGTNRV